MSPNASPDTPLLDDWAPTATRQRLAQRARLIAEVRAFFAEREVLEVETPVLGHAGSTDVGLASLSLMAQLPGERARVQMWLQTSPEFHMKRLLAAGSGSIFQIARAFRDGEVSRRHNPEFCMLEWYRPHYDMYRLMNEVDDLMQQVLECDSAESLSYQQAFIRHLELDPLSADKAQLREAAEKLGEGELARAEEDRDTLLMLLFMLGVEPKIGQDKPCFVYHFPASQAALA
ncbi:MAG: elongation factor P--(R)-beta-lysine ligase, partial [Cobetia crustatorum]